MSNACQRCGAALTDNAAKNFICTVCDSAVATVLTSTIHASDEGLTRRARVLRDTNMGDGLLSAEGLQYPFSLESHWRSDVAPAVNMMVDARFSSAGHLLDVRAVSDVAQHQEKLNAAMNEAREITTRTVGRLRAAGAPLAMELVARIGYANLAAIVALVLGWFVFDTVSIRVTSTATIGLTFYDVLRALHSVNDLTGLETVSRGSAGFYSVLACLSIALSIVPFFFGVRRLWLGLASPLVFGGGVAMGLYWKISSAMNALTGGNDEASQMVSGYARELAAEMLKAVSFGFGFYLTFAASVFLAMRGIARYRAS